MIISLSIKNIVLIDDLYVEFGDGLSVFSGETGAGKSIILDSIALALGARGDSNLVRKDCNQGSVIIVLEYDSILIDDLSLSDYDISDSENIILRRIQYSDGKTKSFLNDMPISLSVMKKIGQSLVEIHGQHDERALLNASTHMKIIDAFGGHGSILKDIAVLVEAIKKKSNEIKVKEDRFTKIEQERKFLKDSYDEIVKLNSYKGEDEFLSNKRKIISKSEKIKETMTMVSDFISGDSGAEEKLSQALGAIHKITDIDEKSILGIYNNLFKIQEDLSDTIKDTVDLIDSMSFDQDEQELLEERLFAIRAAGRKFQVIPDHLPNLAEKYNNDLSLLDSSREEIGLLKKDLDALFVKYKDIAKGLSIRRKESSRDFDLLIMQSLKGLKLESSIFKTSLVLRNDLDVPNYNGFDHLEFILSANPDSNAGPLRSIASGGELSRVMLSIKSVVSKKFGAKTLIFDEIDTGISGSVASAVGEKLESLSDHFQVFTVTHSPQVASKGNHHFLIRKTYSNNLEKNRTSVEFLRLTRKDRIEEISRMMSGSKVTSEARAAAERLMEGE
ncbi:MAG: DNA repair protein RecN [Alphaproteobacteria bacterium]|jgi:DNA repair protein RecN (Recombination protein N)|tara:strand:- start:24536 stop:26215 length:1680 start_codon:yes stop_codon:yes gene_type:complete